jgi:hypothetical protein
MQAVCFSVTSMKFYRILWRYIPEDRTVHSHRCDNLIATFIRAQEQTYISIQFHPRCFLKICLNIIHASTPRPHKWFLPFIVLIFFFLVFFFPTRSTSLSHNNIPDSITVIIFDKEYKLQNAVQ